MNDARRKELRDFLRSELGRQSEELGLDANGRIGWLLEQLENYVERWLGTEAFRSSKESRADDDLWTMIEVAIETTSAELGAVAFQPMVQAWREFVEAAMSVRAGNAEVEPHLLVKSVATIRSTWPA
jgi:hypothetical protein